VLGKILNIVGPKNSNERSAKLYRDLMRAEAKIGGEIFGPVPKGGRREFFCLDEHTWVWHEEWQEKGQHRVRTTRYDVRRDGIVKVQDGHHYQKVSQEEAQKLYRAAKVYQQRVNEKLYKSV
jgi:hypothetical protein